MKIDKELKDKKQELLNYFRNRAEEFLGEIVMTFGSENFKKRAEAINKSLAQTKENLISTVLQKATTENWTNQEKLECILTITYTNYVVMLEARNDVWQYDYMAFSRRIGEMWEPFCKLCFQYSISELSLFIPPLFADVKKNLVEEIEIYIDNLEISEEQKKHLKKYYEKVWGLVSSGEINLELDLHFFQNNEKFVVDFKSGFGSNEKGNTNRLLLVASIYHNLDDNYNCVILVRSNENNHYFQTLQNSKIWHAFSGNETYEEIKKFSGFDIKNWIETNIEWENDFKAETISFFKENSLDQYLKW